MIILSTMVLFAIIVALGLVTVVAVDIMLTTQEAEAKGCSGGGTGSMQAKENASNHE